MRFTMRCLAKSCKFKLAPKNKKLLKSKKKLVAKILFSEVLEQESNQLDETEKRAAESPEFKAAIEENAKEKIPGLSVECQLPPKDSSEACPTKSNIGQELPSPIESDIYTEFLELTDTEKDDEVLLPEFAVYDEIPVACDATTTNEDAAKSWRMEDRDESAGIKRTCLPLYKMAPDKIVIPDDWRSAAEFIANNGDCPAIPPIVVVCGAQNVGKSTFARFLVNTLLRRYTKVGYLDTDVGQPEFTPPGCLSLHILEKPNPDLSTLCLRTPERCYFYGDISPKGDPRAYLRTIVNLYDHFRKEYYDAQPSDKLELSKRVQIPLVVNTHGWVKGIGYDALVDMLRYMVPTHVVQIRLSAVSKNLPFGKFWTVDNDYESSTRLVYLGTATRDSMNKSIVIQKHSRDLREMRIIGYFRQCFIGCPESITSYKEFACALASYPPYQVPIPSIKVAHLHCTVPDSELYYSLNATIVGLAISSKNCGQTLSDVSQPICVGLGIVRGIDISKQLFYVITPVPVSTLQNVDMFLQGFIEIPVSVLQKRGFICPYLSSNTISREGTGAASVKYSKQKDKKSDRSEKG